MDWTADIHQAAQYTEQHLREELTIRDIAQQAAPSPFFQTGLNRKCRTRTAAVKSGFQ